MIRLLKSLFSRCNHEADLDNPNDFMCQKCGCKLSGIRYSTGGIGVTDEFFSWRVRQSYESLKPLINWDERMESVKKRLKEEGIDVEIERGDDGIIRARRVTKDHDDK